MKPVTIAVSVKNSGFGEDLARGLSMLDRPYYIEIAEDMGENAPENRWEVLVTDFERNEGLTACFEPYRVVLAEEDTCRISRISSQIDRAVRKHRDLSAGIHETESMEGEKDRRTGVVFFQGCWGGCGVTSLALAAGRMLSGAYGERVLYLPLTAEDGSLMYRNGMEEETENAGNGMELFYRMRNSRPCDFRSFVCSDSAGLEYLRWNRVGERNSLTEDEKLQFIKMAADKAEYDWILADAGTGNPSVSGAVRIMVDNLQDSRTAYRSAERSGETLTEEIQIVVRNRGLENRMNDGILELIDDGESFVTEESGKVEIVLSKSYAAGIKILSEWLLETVANRVEMW